MLQGIGASQGYGIGKAVIIEDINLDYSAVKYTTAQEEKARLAKAVEAFTVETRAMAEQYDMQVECWYPLGHADDKLLNDEVLSEIAQAHGKSVVQIILRWHMQEGLCAVPGSTNPDHIQENIEIFDFELSDEEMEQIRAIDKGEEGRYFNINYEQMGGFFTQLAE